MNKDSFNWKSLFINEETQKVKNEENNPTSSPETTKFPDVDLNAPTTANYTNPFLSEILDVYQKGFDSLNSSGFDFYELYKSVNAVGVNNPQSYQMAFTMGKTINPELTKQFLQDKAKYYISEIEKVFSKYESTGSGKKTELNNKITQEKNSLTASISDLESKIAQLQNELEKKKNDLAKLDHDNAAEFSEIQLKMEANTIAKQKILESINIVVTGINQYL